MKVQPEAVRLTDRQEAFAVAYVDLGGNATRAALQAGYSPNCARVLGSRLARNPQVQAAIRAEQQRLIGGRLASAALGVLEQVMCDENAPAGARVDAAKTLLDRAGLGAIAPGSGKADDFSPREISPEEIQRLLAESKARLAQLQASKVH
jgi:hypothetical protein